jgi:nucleoside 2-deoxyribosyltransferase
LLPALATVVDPIDPWAFTRSTEIDRARAAGTLRELWLEVGRHNAEAIRASDLLVAVLDGQEIDSGTAAELGYATALGKCCFGLRSDLRQSGEEGMTVNLQVEAFVRDSGGSVVASLSELVAALERLSPHKGDASRSRDLGDETGHK